MSSLKIIGSNLNGEVKIPPSKSIAHRLIIGSSLCSIKCEIEGIDYSKDIEATIDCLYNIGADINKEESKVTIVGKGKVCSSGSNFYCNESGSTLRFLIPISLTIENNVIFKGKGKLLSRPLTTYYNIFKEQNIEYSIDDSKSSLGIKGKLKSGKYYVEGNISSQFITGLLYALPILEGESQIFITSELESKSYIDLTLDVLNKFGIKIVNNDYKSFFIEGNQKYNSGNFKVEGDYSQAAFFLVAGILGGNIECSNLEIESLQGDKVIIDIIKKMSGNIEVKNGNIISKKSKTYGTIIDASDCPDLVPILAVLASLSIGKTEIINASRLRIKESDRLKAISIGLNKLGANVIEKEDGLIIYGKEKLKGGEVDSFNDHRIAMALSIASIGCTENVIINGSEAINKSYPSFFQDFIKLGGRIIE